MSNPPLMVKCFKCETSGKPGTVIRFYYANGIWHRYSDTCDRCGGSGRIAVSMDKATPLLQMAKRHKIDLHEWIENEKKLIYGDSNG